MLNLFDFVTCSCCKSRKIKIEIIINKMEKSRRSINLLSKEKILKEIDAGVDYSIIIAKYKLKSSANVSIISKRDKEIKDALNIQFC